MDRVLKHPLCSLPDNFVEWALALESGAEGKNLGIGFASRWH